MPSDKVNQALERCAKDTFVHTMQARYTNRLLINGFIVEKPKIFKCERRGGEMAQFTMYQFYIKENGEFTYKTYYTLTYINQIIDKLRDMKYITLVNCDCRLDYNKSKHTYTPNAIQLDVIGNTDWRLVEE